LSSIGVYRTTEGEPVFQEVRAPTIGELQGLLVKIIKRILKLLTRQGYLIEEQGMSYLADIDADNLVGALASGLVHLPHCPWAARRTEGAELANGPQPTGEFHAAGLCERARLQPACGGALWGRSAQGTRTPVPLYHPPRHCQRTTQTPITPAMWCCN
jgi:hypothetical protein